MVMFKIDDDIISYHAKKGRSSFLRRLLDSAPLEEDPPRYVPLNPLAATPKDVNHVHEFDRDNDDNDDDDDDDEDDLIW